MKPSYQPMADTYYVSEYLLNAGVTGIHKVKLPSAPLIQFCFLWHNYKGTLET